MKATKTSIVRLAFVLFALALLLVALEPVNSGRSSAAASPTLLAVRGLSSKLTNDQLLIVAAFELEVPMVKTLLAKGANPNARLQPYDDRLFADKWMLAYSHIGSPEWTALQAVANSHREPQPEKPPENTSEAREEAFRRKKAIEKKAIDERDQRRVEIATMLIDAGAKLDFDDGYGATALYSAIAQECEPLSLTLIERGASVSTQTHIYIDGPDNITPLHQAAGQPAVVTALLKRGADVHARTDGGATPLHWAALSGDQESVKLLLAAGADPNAKNDDGDIPSDYSRVKIESLGK